MIAFVKIEYTYGLVVLFEVYFLKKGIYILIKNICKNVFSNVIYSSFKVKLYKCLLTLEWILKLWFFYRIEYYIVMRMNEL